MITTFFLQIPLWFINGFKNILPASQGLPDNIATGIVTFVGYIKGISFFFPIETLFTIFGLVVLFDGGIILWDFMNWIIRKVPGIK